MEFLKKLKTNTEQNQKILYIPVSDLRTNPNQPRKIFNSDELESLSRSIQEVGVIQPLTIRKVGESWELVAGERRLRASVQAGLETVPCIEIDVSLETSSILALVENIQRKDLDYMEEAQAISSLIANFGLSQDEVAKRIGKSQSAVANMLRLLRLPVDVVTLLREGNCTQRHARALLKLPSEESQLEILQKVISDKLNVSQTEQLVELYLNPVEKKEKGKRIIIMKDVRLFLNSINRNLEIMKTAGVNAQYHREESEDEILLTIRIPNKVGNKSSR